jgi:phi LC3 family holin
MKPGSIDWKARLHSKPFWISISSTVVAVIFDILNLCGVVPTITENDVLHVITLLLMIPTTIGIIADPTTAGITDRSQQSK